MKLSEIPQSTSGKKRRKRLGAGMGTGRGKTSTRGMKGSGARSGYSMYAGFEGGQMPLYRKLPRRGFNNKNFRTEYTIVNVNTLEKLSDKKIELSVLIKSGVVGRKSKRLKVLGNGEITRAITVIAEKCSESARKKIEVAGGKVEIDAPVPAPAKEKPAKEKPAKEKPAKEKPAKEKGAKEKPVKEKPVKEKPVKEKGEA